MCLFYIACFAFKCLVFLQLKSLLCSLMGLETEILEKVMVSMFSALCELWFKIKGMTRLYLHTIHLELHPLPKKPGDSR